MAVSPPPHHSTDGETAVSTHSQILAHGLSPVPAEQANYSFLRFGPARFPQYFLTVGP